VFIVMLIMGLAGVGCSTAPVVEGEPQEPIFPVDRLMKTEVDPRIVIYDPWEGFNRSMYKFNAKFDRYIFLPVVNTYKAVMPDIAETAVSNFFRNVKGITTFINCVLQLQVEKALDTFVRVGVNTTLGLFGLIDVATYADIPYHQEDFGQTLGHYGVGMGPYLVLPFFGPSNIRDASGLAVDSVALGQIDPLQLDEHEQRKWAYNVLIAIDTRANVPFRYYQTGSPFEYELIRLLYSTKRYIAVHD
jgi:phospholipid-binding lipoprotein MlaA